MDRPGLLIASIRDARRVTEALLDDIPIDQWYAMPGGVTHVAWQVGHLAMAEYRLCLERVRGRRPDDGDLIGDGILSRYGRGSTPDPDPEGQPTPFEIRSVFDRVHERTLSELAGVSDGELDRPPEIEHRLCKTKAELLGWCSRHEMFHTGQIALLRRMLGADPIW